MNPPGDPQSTALNEGQGCAAKKKTAVVLELLKGNTTAAEIAKNHHLTVPQVQDWVQRFIAGGERQLHAEPRTRREAKGEAGQKRQPAATLRLNYRRKGSTKGRNT